MLYSRLDIQCKRTDFKLRLLARTASIFTFDGTFTHLNLYILLSLSRIQSFLLSFMPHLCFSLVIILFGTITDTFEFVNIGLLQDIN